MDPAFRGNVLRTIASPSPAGVQGDRGNVKVSADGLTWLVRLTTGSGPPAAASGEAGEGYWDVTNGILYLGDGTGWWSQQFTLYVPPAVSHPVGFITRLTGMGVPGRRF